MHHAGSRHVCIYYIDILIPIYVYIILRLRQIIRILIRTKKLQFKFINYIIIIVY